MNKEKINSKWSLERGLKLKKLFIENYKVLKDFEIDFCDSHNSPSPIIILAGVNGSGKTSVLEFLFNIKTHIPYWSTTKSNLKLIDNNQELIFNVSAAKYIKEMDIELKRQLENNVIAAIAYTSNELFIRNIKNYLFYLPIYQEKINCEDCEDYMIDLKLSILTFFRKRVKELDSFSKALSNIKKFIDETFNDMGIYFELHDIDDSEKGKEKIFFRNKITQDIFLIEYLSSGEKVLLLKMLYLYFKDIKDTVILIDEPELSLHPTWQSKILKLYENYAKRNNCQIIIATHSPLILSSAKNEYIRILYFEENRVKVAKDVFSYGRDIEWVLQEVMGVEYIRNKEIVKQLDSIYKLIEENKLDEAEEEINKLESVIGSNDSEILKLRNEIDFKRIEFEEDY